MAQRTSTTYSHIEAQSFRPVFIQSISFTTSAAVSMLIPFTSENGPGAEQDPLAGSYGRRGSLLILQPSVDVYVRLVGQGTSTPASQTVTYSSSAGAQTVTIQGVLLTLGTGASDTANGDLLVAAIRDSRLLSPWLTANNAAGVVTIKSRLLGAGFAATTLAVTGTGATRGGATFSGGTGPTAATASTNAILIPANALLPLYRFPEDVQIDVKGSSASGVLNIFAGY